MTLVDDISDKMRKIATTTQSTAAQMNNVGKQIDNAFKSNAPNTFASQAGNAMQSVSGNAESLGETIDSIFDDVDAYSFASEVNAGFSTATQGADEFYDAANSAGESIDELADSAGDLGDAIDDIDGNSGLDDVGDDAKKTGEQLEKAADSALNLGSILKTAFAVVSVAKITGEIEDFVSSSVDIGKNFTAMMSEVGAISGATGSELATLEETARAYGSSTIFSATESAEALKYMSLAGWDASQSASALGGVLNLAAASGMGLGEASDMLTDYLSAFGMEAQQSTYFADMLAYAQSKSNTSAAQLGEAYLNSAANLHSAGQDIETTTSLLEAMANQGTKGSRAGTQIAAIARDITNSMEDGKIKIGDASIAVQDAQGNFRDFTDILTDVESAVDGMGTAQRATALATTFTADSTKGINQILTEGMDNISMYEEALRSSSGAAEEAAAMMNDNLTGDLANMNSAFEEMQLQVYEGMEGTAREGAQYLTNTVIPLLTEWVPEAISTVTEGVGEFGEALSPLLETVLKNPQGVATAFMSIGTGIAAFKTINRVGALVNLVQAGGALSEAGGLVGGLAKFGAVLTAHPWAAGAAAVVAAITAIGSAIHKYNEQQIDDSLSEHFGTVELTASQIESVAGHILNAKYLVSMDLALDKIENADQLAEEAEQALAENDALEWKASIGMKWDDTDVNEYSQNIDTFIESSINELEDRTYAATITVETMLGGTEEGEILASNMEQWASTDQLEMSTLSKQLKSAIEKALEDGVLDVNEQAAITILQTKMNNILSGWKEADAQAELDLISQKYGSASGKELTEDSFSKIVDELSKQREENDKNIDSSYTQLMSTLHGLDNSGRLEEAGFDYEDLESKAGEAYRNASASSLANSVNFETTTLSDTYGDLLEENKSKMQEQTKNYLSEAGKMLGDADSSELFEKLMAGSNEAMVSAGIFSSGDQKALESVYESMQPDVSAMQDLMSEYREAGQAIPEELMTSFNNAMEIGAAAGDQSAAWQVFANQMVADPANDALVQAIQNGTQSAPEELKNALDIALAKTTTDPLDMDELTVRLSSIDMDAEQIAELTGMTVEEINQILSESDVEAETTATVDVTTQAGEVDESGATEVGEKAEETAKSEAGKDTTVEKTANVTYVEGEKDTSQLNNSGTEKLESGTAEQEVTTNKTYITGNEDKTQLSEDQTISSTATMNVTAETGSDNFSETASSFASKFQSALKSAFDKTFTATTKASITVDYSIANPTKTITFSGGGSGTATVTAHATGGIFDEPHYGVFAEAGPEAFIPIDGSDNAKEIWRETGERLGMLSDDKPIQVEPTSSVNEGNASGNAGEKSSNRTIDININGSGKIATGRGLTKEDILEVLMERAKDVFVSIIEQEALVGGDESYEY
jgi:TP901 family phage tail tape measure protein